MNPLEDKSLIFLYGLLTWGIYELRNFRVELYNLRTSIEKVSEEIDNNISKHISDIEEKLEPINNVLKKIV